MKRTKQVNGRVYEFQGETVQVFSMTHMGKVFIWAITLPNQEAADQMYADMSDGELN